MDQIHPQQNAIEEEWETVHERAERRHLEFVILKTSWC